MIKDTSLLVTLFVIGFYLVFSLWVIGYQVLRPPIRRLEYFFTGFFLMFMAAFMLVPVSEIIVIATDKLNQSATKLTADQISQLKEFKYVILFFSFLFTFIVAGTGVNMFTHGITYTQANTSIELQRQILSEVRSVSRDVKKGHFLALLQLVLIVVSLCLLVKSALSG